jgi:hypothetical protein
MKIFRELTEQIAKKRKQMEDEGKISVELSGTCDPVLIRTRSDPMSTSPTIPAGMRINQ